jgi:hypothetical protein
MSIFVFRYAKKSFRKASQMSKRNPGSSAYLTAQQREPTAALNIDDQWRREGMGFLVILANHI